MDVNSTSTTDNSNPFDFVFNYDNERIAIIARLTSSLSILGSTYIIQDVLRNPIKRAKTISRLMLGLSIMDIISSFFCYFMKLWPLPKGYIPEALGTVATCDCVAFFSTIGLFAAPLYNCSLATYYLLQLKYNWTQSKIRAAEKRMHLFPTLVASIIAIVGLVTKAYGPFGSTCWVTPEYPFGCQRPDSSEKCIRGGYKHLFFFWFILALCWIFAFVYVSITMYYVYKHVSNIEIQSFKFTFTKYSSKRNSRMRSLRIMVQGIMYAFTMLLIYIFPLLALIVSMVTRKETFAILILWNTFAPLQGFFNFLIYLMPLYMKMNKKCLERLEKKVAQLRKNEEKKDYNTKQVIIDKQIEDESEIGGFIQSNGDGTRQETDLHQHGLDDSCSINVSEKLCTLYSCNKLGDESKKEKGSSEENHDAPTKEEVRKSVSFFSILSSVMQYESESDAESNNDSGDYHC